jgi:hypothetical protein
MRTSETVASLRGASRFERPRTSYTHFYRITNRNPIFTAGALSKSGGAAPYACTMPNAQAEGAGWLAQSMPSRSEEIAWTVTDNRLPSSASFGPVFLLKANEMRCSGVFISVPGSTSRKPTIPTHYGQVPFSSFALRQRKERLDIQGIDIASPKTDMQWSRMRTSETEASLRGASRSEGP